MVCLASLLALLRADFQPDGPGCGVDVEGMGLGLKLTFLGRIPVGVAGFLTLFLPTEGEALKLTFLGRTGLGIPEGVVAFLTLDLPTEEVEGLLAFIICLSKVDMGDWAKSGDAPGDMPGVDGTPRIQPRVVEHVSSIDALGGRGVWPRPL